MKALVLKQPGRLVPAEVSLPAAPGPGEALVRVHRIGVCGTDLHAFTGHQPYFTYPRILGHELGVEVVAVGDGVENISPGERCAVEPYLNCGNCIACRRGKGNCCRELKVMGVHVDGGMREQFVLPAAKLHPSASLSYEQLALIEPLGIGAHAVQRAALDAGETVAVLGAGPIGLSVIQFARAAGARVLVVDVNDARLAFCRTAFGLPETDCLDARVGEPATLLADRTGGNMPTAVFDATGNAQSMTGAFLYPSHGGRLIFVGLFRGELTFSDPEFHRRELTVLGSRNSQPADFRRIIQLVESDQIDTAPWITHRASLDAVPGLFRDWTKPENGVLKAMIEVP